MIKVDVRGIKEVQAKLAGISRDLHAKVLGPAINKVAAKAVAEINRAIPQEYAVKAGDVRNAVTLRKAHAGNLEAVISVFGSARKKGRSLNMIHFLAAVQAAGRAVKTRGTKGNKAQLAALQKQLGFLIKKGGGLKTIDGAFLGNKGRTVFQRVGKERLPIKPVQVIGFSQMFASRKISTRITDKIRADFAVEIDRAIARLNA